MNPEYQESLPFGEAEHVEHIMGEATECRNCLTEAKQALAAQNDRVDTAAASLVDAGFFVVVSEWAAYCRATDAICGKRRALEDFCLSRGAADARARDLSNVGDEEVSYYVLPLLPPARLLETADDGVPF